MITAYSQNLEDVLLWRALSSVTPGHYVDVGAQDPDVDSVTRTFYEHGWRGINIEPTLSCVERLRQRRPDDVTLELVVGDRSGQVEFFEVAGKGWSTIDAEHGQEMVDAGEPVVIRTVAMETLDTVLAEHPLPQIHFLKIDVEGAEATVLAGLDLVRWSPWVVVIEATRPGTRILDDGWEHVVLDAGYSKVFFDGLNNFYVSDQHPELRESFRTPVNVFDDFKLVEGHGLGADPSHLHQQIASLSARARDLTESLAASQSLITQLESWAQSAESWARQTESQLDQTRDRAKALEKQAAEALAEAHRQHALVEAYTSSTSWRVTAPLRAVTTVGRLGVKGAARPFLERGLGVVRRNALLRRGLRSMIRRVPAVERAFQSFANARPQPPRQGEA